MIVIVAELVTSIHKKISKRNLADVGMAQKNALVDKVHRKEMLHTP